MMGCPVCILMGCLARVPVYMQVVVVRHGVQPAEAAAASLVGVQRTCTVQHGCGLSGEWVQVAFGVGVAGVQDSCWLRPQCGCLRLLHGYQGYQQTNVEAVSVASRLEAVGGALYLFASESRA